MQKNAWSYPFYGCHQKSLIFTSIIFAVLSKQVTPSDLRTTSNDEVLPYDNRYQYNSVKEDGETQKSLSHQDELGTANASFAAESPGKEVVLFEDREEELDEIKSGNGLVDLLSDVATTEVPEPLTRTVQTSQHPAATTTTHQWNPWTGNDASATRTTPTTPRTLGRRSEFLS